MEYRVKIRIATIIVILLLALLYLALPKGEALSNAAYPPPGAPLPPLNEIAPEPPLRYWIISDSPFQVYLPFIAP